MDKAIVNSLRDFVEAKYPSMKEGKDGTAFYTDLLPFAERAPSLEHFSENYRKIYGDPYVVFAIEEWFKTIETYDFAH